MLTHQKLLQSEHEIKSAVGQFSFAKNSVIKTRKNSLQWYNVWC